MPGYEFIMPEYEVINIGVRCRYEGIRARVRGYWSRDTRVLVPGYEGISARGIRVLITVNNEVRGY